MTPRARTLDVVVAVVLAVPAFVANREHLPSAVAATVWVLALALRSTAPLAMSAVASAGILAYAVVPDPLDQQPFLAALVIAFSVGSELVGPRRWCGAGLMLACAYVMQVRTTDLDLATTVLTPLVLVLGPVLAGATLRHWRDTAVALRRVRVQLADERERYVRAAALEERDRIARELHDVISHSVTAMVVQAGAAEQQLAPDSVDRERVHAVRRAGQEALAELRRQLGVLRRAEQDGRPA